VVRVEEHEKRDLFAQRFELLRHLESDDASA
jgi:hypothetical protein